MNEEQMMLTKEEIADILRKAYPYLASEYRVKRVGMFGSYAKGLSTEASDIDIVVEFERPIGFRFIELTEYLESLLGKSVDVLTPAGIQGIRVDRIARSIKESIVYV
jgi:predicted nucleotidyltransferase